MSCTGLSRQRYSAVINTKLVSSSIVGAYVAESREVPEPNMPLVACNAREL